MELDSKQKLLIAIYSEYQKDIPDMTLVTHLNLEMQYEVFKMAVAKLVNESLITEADITYGGSDTVPMRVNLKFCMMTPYGIEYVEKKIGIDNQLSGEQKVKTVIDKAGKWGWDQFKDFGARVLAEILTK
ncbi:hypothetical protein KDC22_14530 [Paenibacillus tritici]|uniref:hypothetical protein n=1 Tax=Paenibacillus tritici TaxID=1873425 RepID=UPI001BA5BE2A|nr:hypothetical protein [Paenibacillus tritici]QUL57583.1 hypothetical protein KDC22_14530 [Paenibacillus tritici]